MAQALFNITPREEMLEITPVKAKYVKKIAISQKDLYKLAKSDLLENKETVLRLIHAVIDNPDSIVHERNASRFSKSFIGSGGVKRGFQFHNKPQTPLVVLSPSLYGSPENSSNNSELNVTILITDDEDGGVREISKFETRLKVEETLIVQKPMKEKTYVQPQRGVNQLVLGRTNTEKNVS